MKPSEIVEGGVYYFEGVGGHRRAGERKVIIRYIDGVTWASTDGPYQGKPTFCSLEHFARWAKKRIYPETERVQAPTTPKEQP